MSGPVRRLSALRVVVIVVLVVALAGCGASPTPVWAGRAPGPQALEGADGPVTVTLWHGLGGSTATALDARIDEFNRSHVARIRVESAYQGTYADTLAKYTAAVRDGSTPGILVSNDVTSGFIRDVGQTVPAQDLMSADPTGLQADQLVPAARTYYSAEGRLFAVPLVTSTPLLYVNPDLLAAAGVDPATLGTLDGVARAARTVHARTGVAGLTQAIDGWWYEQLAAGAGESWCTPDNGRGSASATSLTLGDGTRRTLAVLAGLYADGAALNTGVDGNQTLRAFNEGRAAMMLNSSGAIGGLYRSGPAHWTALPYPISGDQATSGPVIGGAAMWVDGAHHDAAHIAAAWQVVSFLAAAPSQIAISRATGYAPINVAADHDPAQAQFLAGHPAFATLQRQLTGTPAVTATAGCLSGAMTGIRSEVVATMQSVLTGSQPLDAALRGLRNATDTALSDYREQARR